MSHHEPLSDVIADLQAAGITIVKDGAGRTGREARCVCPYCDDSTGHLYVNKETGAAYCHKCQRRTHVAEICGRAQTAVPDAERTRRNVLALAADYYHARLTPEAHDYLKQERGLSRELIARFRLGWADGGLADHLIRQRGATQEDCLASGVLIERNRQVRDFFRGRIVIPNVVAGQVVHLTARAINASEPKYLHLPGKIDHLFNEDAARQPRPFIVEGPFDVFGLEAWGYPAVAVLGAGHLTEQASQRFANAELVYVGMDGDEAGTTGALRAAAVLGDRARIVALPDGRDPADLYRAGAKQEFEDCLARAQDLLEYEINALPSDSPRTELARALETVLQRMTGIPEPRAEAYLRIAKDRFHLSADEVKAYRQRLGTLRKSAAASGEAAAPDAASAELRASFEGLVDIVEHDGEPAFLVQAESGVQIVGQQPGPPPVAPPPREQMPWALAAGDEVIRLHAEDGDPDLYDAIRQYLTTVSELPSDEHYDLLTTWVLHTYLLDNFQYSPILCLYAVPERGKTRTGKALIYLAYRGLHVESLREAYLLRIADRFQASLFFDVLDIWRKAEKENSQDVLLQRFERGAKVPRVNNPDRGPFRDTDYYEVFGPTIIGTNRQAHHILETRGVTVNMPEASRRFENDITPHSSLGLKNRLVAFRGRWLGRSLPEAAKPTPGRLGDIMRPLIQVICAVRPERESVLLGLISAIRQQRTADKADSLEGLILRAILDAREETPDGQIMVKELAERVNASLPEQRRVTYQKVGKRLRALGLDTHKIETGAALDLSDPKLERVMVSYGLSDSSETSEMSGTGPGEATAKPAADESDESDVSSNSIQVFDLSQGPPPGDTLGTPEELAREAAEEREAIRAADRLCIADDEDPANAGAAVAPPGEVQL